MTFVIITAGIDLSVGALLGLSSVLTATMMIYGRLGPGPDAPRSCCRWASPSARSRASISTRFRLEPFIVTLAGLQAARGLALVVSDNQYINISYGEGPGLAPPVFAVLGERLFDNVGAGGDARLRRRSPLIATLVLNTTRFGRYVFAVGGNERAARLSGVPVPRSRSRVYAITGFAAAIAGIVHAGQFNFGSANDGTGYELTAIAAVVIGGTSLFGGAGSMVGTVAGAVMLGALANILQLNNITPALQLLATGAIIVLAAVLQSLVRRREGLDPLSRRRTGAQAPDDDRRSGRTEHRQGGESCHARPSERPRRAGAGAAGAVAAWRSAGGARLRPARQGLREGRPVRHRLLAGQQRRALPPARQRRADGRRQESARSSRCRSPTAPAT